MDLTERLASHPATFSHHVHLQYSTTSESCPGEACPTMAARDTRQLKHCRGFPSSLESLVKIRKSLFPVLRHGYSSLLKETPALELHGHLDALCVRFVLFARKFKLRGPKEAMATAISPTGCAAAGARGPRTHGLQNLILLNLNNNQLTWIPPEISRLRSVTYLSINHNQLASIPRELCFLENLSELQLNYNQLICVPEEIKFLKKLQKLLLVRNNIEVLPEGLCDLINLKSLDIAGNIIQIFPSRFQNLKLRELYCEENPLLLRQPVKAVGQEDVWTLQEITSRFIMNQLAEKNLFLMQAIEWYPQVRNMISQGRKCAICGKSFLTVWLECVEFVPPSKNWKISRNLQLVPLRILICSYKCFNQRGPNLFGIAQA
ncbi:hypothetical protein HPG69_011604 [Diceros bicornis minor]|uniref:Leucine-rich repeat-containing protein 69 n=1 Tax=Diceros bicornis minor TaxID=77932 RepID=A0A7J7EHK6_DICBM|nr:hypothetical protein HPG69_011604 [Diceros bicornis minor]